MRLFIMPRGQASVELLSILAIGLVVLGIILASSKSAFEDSITSYNSKILENDLSYLSTASSDIFYNSQPGSYTRSKLHIPNTVIPENSSFSAKDNLVVFTLEQKYGIKEIPQPFEVPVEWKIPFQPGDYEVYIVNRRGHVEITQDPSFIVLSFSNNPVYITFYNPSFDSHRLKIYSNNSLLDAIDLGPRSVYIYNYTASLDSIRVVADNNEEVMLDLS